MEIPETDRPTCDACGGRAIPIVYGYPTGLEKDVYQGGCIVHPGAPNWWCDPCEASVFTAGDETPMVAGAAVIYMTGTPPAPTGRGLLQRLRRSRRRRPG